MPRVRSDWSDDGAICPHCGHLNHIESDEQDGSEFECYECEKPFTLAVDYSVQYQGVADIEEKT